MRITLIFTGKTEESYLKDGIDLYVKRISRYIPTGIKIISEPVKKSGSHNRGNITDEYKKLTSVKSGQSFKVLLDEKGEQLTSDKFAGFIEKKMVMGYRELVFLTGGAYGFTEEIYHEADSILSLSAMTFTHQMVRLILVEQLYRAMTIIRGEPYHH